MLNLKSFDDFVKNIIVEENQIEFSQRDINKVGYEQFSRDIINRILNRENINDNYKWEFNKKKVLVINDYNLANSITKLGAEVLYIHMDYTNDKNDYSYFKPNIKEKNILNKSEFESKIDEFYEKNKCDSFDMVINISIPTYEDDKNEHLIATKIAVINQMIFESSIMRNKVGVDKTPYYSIDDVQTLKSFKKLINNNRYKNIEPQAIGSIINSTQADNYGFATNNDRTLIRIFINSLGNVKADVLDKEESNETIENINAKNVFIGRTNPNIYCFKTLNVKDCLKVGDTFRPVSIRMDEWKKVFGTEKEGFEHKDSWEWSAVENNWVFRDYTVHKYLKNMKKSRLYNKKKYEEYFTPISDAYNIDNTYSNEFFINTAPEDVEEAILNIRKDIRNNINTLRDSLKPFKEESEETGIPFYDERELQKKAINNFSSKLDGNSDSNDFLIYAVMRFGKTYTAIRCLQEFYKRKKDNCSNFSIITTAKTEVKNEWISGIKRYISDNIDETGKGGYKDEDISKEENMSHTFTSRPFSDFEIFTIEELKTRVMNFFIKLEKEKHNSEITNKFVLEKPTLKNIKSIKPDYYLGKNALEKFIELGGNKGKHIVLFVSLQDLAGSNDDIKYKHKFFYDCPLDMMIFDETHFAVRAKSLGVAGKTRKDFKEYDGLDDVEKDGVDKLNNLNITENTIKLHLSGTPYKILKNHEFSDDNILAAFTATHLRLEKEKWERENEPKRISWEEEQEKLRNEGNPDAKEEWENPYAPDKNPYFGIPKLSHYAYDLSKFNLTSLKENTDYTTCMEELFRVVNAKTGETISSEDYKTKYSSSKPDVKFLYDKDVIKLFRIIDGARRDDEEKKILSLLNIPQIKTGNMCKNILIALPTKDACDALAELLKRKLDDGSWLFKILGKYEIINAAGRRNKTENPINVIRGLEEYTITLTCDMLLTGVTVEPWDTIFYMKDGSSPEGYDQAKFRVQSPYINKLPIFDKNILAGKKPSILKQDLKPQTLFVDFLPSRMFKILDEQMRTENALTGATSSEILKSTPVIVLDGSDMKELTSDGFSDRLNDILEKEGGDTGYMRILKKIHCSNEFLDNDDVMDKLWEFNDYTRGVDNDEEPNDEESQPSGKKPKKTKKGNNVKKTPKPKTIDKLREARKAKFESFINSMSIYNILRKDRNDRHFVSNDDVLGKMIESIEDKRNQKIVHAVFFNNNFKVTDDKCVKKVTEMLTILRKEFIKSVITKHGVESTIDKVENIMNKSISSYKKLSLMFNAAGNNKLGTTEYISDQRLIKKMINSDFVIFNNGCSVLDCYGSKIGEFANYIFNDDEVKRTKGIVNPKNYYVLCYTHLTYEMNKFALADMGVDENHILFCNNIKDIEDKLGKMTFDVIVGNPPYKGHGNPLYMKITKTIYTHNMKDDGVMCMINPTGLIDNKYDDDKLYKSNRDKYEKLKLLDFYYDPSIRGIFTSADIGNDIGLFIYGKNGSHTIYDDYVSIKRFGKDYMKSKSIIDITNKFDSVINLVPYIYLPSQEKLKAADLNKDNHRYVVCSFNRGHVAPVSGGHKWDWTTLMNSMWLVVQNSLPINGQSSFDFDDDFDSAVNLIKWFNTDFVQFIINYYKNSIANPKSLYMKIPQPLKSGDFSDKSICDEFGLKPEDMEYIHEAMRDYGWKTKTNNYFISDFTKAGYKLPTIKLDGTEKTLLKYIEELNELNKDIKSSGPDLNNMTDEEIENYFDDMKESGEMTDEEIELTRNKIQQKEVISTDEDDEQDDTDFKKFIADRGKDDYEYEY